MDLYPLFEYRIVATTTVPVQYMPQRGVPTSHGGLVSNFLWRDAVPYPAPSYAVAETYVRSITAFDQKQTPGEPVTGPVQEK